jgi:hypothetical protein
MSVRPQFDTLYRSDFRSLVSTYPIRPFLRLTLIPPTGGNMYFTTFIHDTSAHFVNSDGRLMDVDFPTHDMEWGSVSWGVNICVTDQTTLQLFIQKYYNNTVAPWGGLLSFWFLSPDDTEGPSSDYVICSGIMNNCEIEDDGETAVVACTFDSGLGVWDRSSELLYTTEHQKTSGAPGDPDRSADLGFAHVPYLASWKGVWGKPIPPTKRPVKVKKKGRLK